MRCAARKSIWQDLGSLAGLRQTVWIKTSTRMIFLHVCLIVMSWLSWTVKCFNCATSPLRFWTATFFKARHVGETNSVISSQPDYSQARTWLAILQQQSIEAIKGVKRMCLQSVSLNANHAARRLVLRLGYLHQEGLNTHFCCNAERSDKKSEHHLGLDSRSIRLINTRAPNRGFSFSMQSRRPYISLQGYYVSNLQLSKAWL